MTTATHEHPEHHHHELPTSGGALTGVAFSATLHCLTGCAIGEITGMAIGTALGFSDLATIALAIGLAFLFGYTLTSLPLLRAGFAIAAVVPIALASDTVSIAIMEIVDNAIMLLIPGAMEAGIDSLLFWGSLSIALVIAGAAALPVNRWLIARGKGHVAVHNTGVHGGPPTRVVAAVAAVAAVFGVVVLAAEGFDERGAGDHQMASGGHDRAEGRQQMGAGPGAQQDPVRGLAVAEGGLKLELVRTELPRGRETELRFRVVDAQDRPIREFEVEHDRRMHLILARRDLTGFQHLHPELGEDGMWRISVTVPEAGSYRVFADFKHRGSNRTLAADLAVDGDVDWRELPPVETTADTGDGYEVRLDAEPSRAGQESELRFTVTRGGEPVELEPYLGAGGHLVALREGDLAYLHVHPAGHAPAGGPIGDSVVFASEFPSEGRYRLFLQLKHAGRVHTAAFTHEAIAASGGDARPSGEPKDDHHGE